MLEENTNGMDLQDARTVPREIKRPAVRIVETLGAGNFGEVSKAILTETSNIPGYIVAVKVLHMNNDDAQTTRSQLLAEASIMAQFDNNNVARLVGVVTVGDPLLVIIEYCEKGSLESYLEKTDPPLHTKLQITVDCAKGMAYLASLRFIHRDLASRNVLLGSDMTAKIGDFGMSRETQDKAYYTSSGGPLPVRWTAPEALEQQKFSEKSDVWSFGILMYEIWTQAMLPYTGWNNEKVWVKVLDSYRLPHPLDCPEDIYGIMYACWLPGPDLRPSFSVLVDVISELLDDAPIGQQVLPKQSPEEAAPTEFDHSYMEIAFSVDTNITRRKNGKKSSATQTSKDDILTGSLLPRSLSFGSMSPTASIFPSLQEAREFITLSRKKSNHTVTYVSPDKPSHPLSTSVQYQVPDRSAFEQSQQVQRLNYKVPDVPVKGLRSIAPAPGGASAYTSSNAGHG